jgi:hypothetical protein
MNEVKKWALRAYLTWSVCADITLIAGVVWLIIF